MNKCGQINHIFGHIFIDSAHLSQLNISFCFFLTLLLFMLISDDVIL